MKKEIEIEFKDLKATLKENLIIGVYINEEKVDEITLQKDCVFIRADIPICLILGIEDCLSLKDYLDIPEIKALHDERFRKEIDLFWWFGVGTEYFYFDESGKVDKGRVKYPDWRGTLEKNYNRFQTREQAENASAMSLDERKQFLWQIANDCVFDSISLNQTFSVVQDMGGEYVVVANTFLQNVEFEHEKDAQECADWMNRGVSGGK